MAIPRVFHQIWIGGTLPERFDAMRHTWADLNPGWELKLWGEDDLAWLKSRALFEAATSSAQKADIASFEILHRYGGVYLDVDFECLRPVGDIFDGAQLVVTRVKRGWISAGMLAAGPGHPYLAAVVAALPFSCILFRKWGQNVQSGMGLLERVFVGGHWEGRPGVRVVDRELFYPYDITELERAGESFDDAVAVHHWAYTWEGDTPVRVPWRLVWEVGSGDPRRVSRAAVTDLTTWAGYTFREITWPLRQRIVRLVARPVRVSSLPGPDRLAGPADQ